MQSGQLDVVDEHHQGGNGAQAVKGGDSWEARHSALGIDAGWLDWASVAGAGMLPERVATCRRR